MAASKESCFVALETGILTCANSSSNYVTCQSDLANFNYSGTHYLPFEYSILKGDSSNEMTTASSSRSCTISRLTQPRLSARALFYLT